MDKSGGYFAGKLKKSLSKKINGANFMSELQHKVHKYLKTSPPIVAENRNLKDYVWASVQPVLVLGSMILVAYMVTSDWSYHGLFGAVMIVLPIPLLLFAERIWAKGKDWFLEPKEMAEDTLWLAFAGLLWIPLFSDYYKIQLSEGFKAFRDLAPL